MRYIYIYISFCTAYYYTAKTAKTVTTSKTAKTNKLARELVGS